MNRNGLAGGFIVAIFPFSLGNCKLHKTIPFADLFNSRQWGALICHFHQLASKLLSVALTFFCLSPQETGGIVEAGLAFVLVSVLRILFCGLFSTEKNTLFFIFLSPYGMLYHFFYFLCLF